MSVTLKHRPKFRNAEKSNVPTLAQMIVAGQRSQAKIKRATEEALHEWLKQSERLQIARDHYKLKGSRFIDFARRVGIDKSSAYLLIRLHDHKVEVLERCEQQQEEADKRGESYHFPGWLAALNWVEYERLHQEIPAVPWQHASDDWGSPQNLFDFLHRLYRFDVDVCATTETAKCRQFWTKEQNGLKQHWESGKAYWMNPPYSKAGSWAKKAQEAGEAGAVVVGLFANRSASKWYRDYVVPSAAVVMLHGRQKFSEAGKPVADTNMSSAPFASILVIWPKKAADKLRGYTTPITAMLLKMPD